MAKKSKSKSKINSVCSLVAIILAVVAIVMIFTDVCGIKTGDKTNFVLTGIQATFGFSEDVKIIGTQVYSVFSFMNSVVYALVLAAAVLVVLRLCKVLKSGIIDWVAAAMFMISGILFFLMPNFVVYGEAWKGLADTALKLDGVKTILVGAIISGIASILAAGSVIAGKFIKK